MSAEVMYIVEANGARLRACCSADDAAEFARELVAEGFELVMSYPVEEDEDLFYSINR